MRPSNDYLFSCARVPLSRWVRKSSTPRRTPQGRSSFVFIVEPMGNSIFMKMGATATSTRKASTL